MSGGVCGDVDDRTPGRTVSSNGSGGGDSPPREPGAVGGTGVGLGSETLE